MKKLIYLLALMPMIAFSGPTCPDAFRIISIGVDNTLFRDSANNWTGFRTSQRYNTNALWTFVLYNIRANSNFEAFIEARNALFYLKFQSGPIQGRSPDEWFCTYKTLRYEAITVTPALTPGHILSAKLSEMS